MKRANLNQHGHELQRVTRHHGERPADGIESSTTHYSYRSDGTLLRRTEVRWADGVSDSGHWTLLRASFDERELYGAGKMVARDA